MSMPNLQLHHIPPDHIIFDHILPTLPVKTLIRFKSVSKLWHLTISSSKFAKTHLNSYVPSSNQCLLLTAANNLLLLPYDESNSLKSPLPKSFNVAPYLEKPNILIFAGYCNGLFCLYYCGLSERFFLLCNPALHQFCNIKHPTTRTFLSPISWFGYIPSADDYKIVAAFLCKYDADVHAKDKEFYVFSLRTRKWKRTCDFDAADTKDDILSYSTTVIDDVLYLSPCGLDRLHRLKRIVGFDLVNHTLKEFPWMDWLSRYRLALFFVMNGCLSLLCSSPDRVSDVWMLKQHGDWSSWEIVYSVDVRDVGVKSFTPAGKLLVGNCGMKHRGFFHQCSIIDLRNEDGQQRSQGDAYIYFDPITGGAAHFVESLISPFGTNIWTEEENYQA